MMMGPENSGARGLTDSDRGAEIPVTPKVSAGPQNEISIAEANLGSLTSAPAAFGDLPESPAGGGAALVVGTLRALLHPRMLLAAIRTGWAIRPEMVDGKLELVLTSRAKPGYDPHQPEEGNYGGQSNRYFAIFQRLKEDYSSQYGSELTILSRKLLRESGVGIPAVYLAPDGSVEMRNHHRILAITDNPGLNLRIVVNPWYEKATTLA
jgi:hypothetical protein